MYVLLTVNNKSPLCALEGGCDKSQVGQRSVAGTYLLLKNTLTASTLSRSEEETGHRLGSETEEGTPQQGERTARNGNLSLSSGGSAS